MQQNTVNNTYNSPQIEYIVNNPSNIVQSVIISRWPKMVNRILSVIEMAIAEGRQYSKIKKALSNTIYDTRNKMLLDYSYFDEYKPDDINKHMNNLITELDNILSISFSISHQKDAICTLVLDIVKNVHEDIITVLKQ